MRWQQGRRSRNIEDRRGQRAATGVALGGGTLLVVIVAMLLGADPRAVMKLVQSASPPPAEQGPALAPGQTDELADFVAVVLGDIEDTWHALFRQMGQEYQEPHLVLFTDRVQSACGIAGSATGPFYCPADHKVYIDLGFYRDLKERHNAPGDFAQAYVIAHEVGHHVQNLLGILPQVNQLRGRVSETEFNDLSVRLELQADFYAGVWAHHAHKARNILERGDIEEALNAASAIGDDRLQREAQGYVRPDSFTHGTSEQRARWFRRGFETGDIQQGDTFQATAL